MKRLTCLLLLFCLFLSGCSALGERTKDPVTFYYIREDYRKDMGDVIASEIRESSGHRNDLPYLLALYSMGPSKEGLMLPIPRGTQIMLTEHTEKGLVLSLSERAQTMADSDFTLACACLSMTCMELTDTDQVTVFCGDRSITIHEENLLLYSGDMQQPTEEK